MFSISCHESSEGASKKESSEYPKSKIVGIHPTASSISSKDLKKIIYIKTVQDCTQDRALANTISQTEDAGEGTIPADIGKLVDIDKDEESYEDCRKSSIKKFLEQQRVLHHIECFAYVHHAAKDLTTIPKKVVYCLHNSPSAHRSRAARLIGKLKLI